MSRPRGGRAKARTRTPKPQLPESKPPKPVAAAEALPSEAAKPKTGLPDSIGFYLSIVGGIAVVASWASHLLQLIIGLGIAYILFLIALAIHKKSIKWPAWRVIIALALVGVIIFLYYAPPKTETFTVNMYQFSGWNIINPPLYDFPVSDNPQTGHQFSNYEFDSGSENAVNVRCWTQGHLTGHPKVSISWVSIKGGAYDGLWIPYEAIAMDGPGLAGDLPNCDSFWFKLLPFL